jgi:signal transduction histidine kinase
MGEVIDDRKTAPPAEMTLVDRNGNHKEVIIASVPITHDGEPAAQIVIKDVTELKEREYELQRQRDQLDEFASIVSHDLRNPLEVLRGRLDLAREECDSEHLDAAMETQERMATLVDDLLRFARVGERAVEEEPLDLETVATAAWQNVATPDATLTVESTPTLEGDPNRVAELLENLFSNAIEHGGEDVTVTVGRLDGGFFVGDDGTVIPPAERADVFEYGYSSSDEGTGIGLAVVKQIAGAHDWTIDVCESSAGGTRFEFRTADPGE